MKLKVIDFNVEPYDVGTMLLKVVVPTHEIHIDKNKRFVLELKSESKKRTLNANSNEQQKQLKTLQKQLKTLKEQLTRTQSLLKESKISLTQAEKTLKKQEESLNQLTMQIESLEHKARVVKRQRSVYAGVAGLFLVGFILK